MAEYFTIESMGFQLFGMSGYFLFNTQEGRDFSVQSSHTVNGWKSVISKNFIRPIFLFNFVS